MYVQIIVKLERTTAVSGFSRQRRNPLIIVKLKLNPLTGLVIKYDDNDDDAARSNVYLIFSSF